MTNADVKVIESFGDEWSRYDQTALSESDLRNQFDDYFHIFPWDKLPENAVGADIGCGSGRWAKLVAQRVGVLHCVEPAAKAMEVAKAVTPDNCQFQNAGVSEMVLPPLDFAYCLGVLHHIPDTAAGLKSCTTALKPGAPFLVYLYYDFENRPVWFRALWKASDFIRRPLCRLPPSVLHLVTLAVAAVVYWPLARLSRGRQGWPLSWYADKPFYAMATDSRDRFGTRLEQRFSRAEIRQMMQAAGLERIEFSDRQPHWVAVGYKV